MNGGARTRNNEVLRSTSTWLSNAPSDGGSPAVSAWPAQKSTWPQPCQRALAPSPTTAAGRSFFPEKFVGIPTSRVSTAPPPAANGGLTAHAAAIPARCPSEAPRSCGFVSRAPCSAFAVARGLAAACSAAVDRAPNGPALRYRAASGPTPPSASSCAASVAVVAHYASTQGAACRRAPLLALAPPQAATPARDCRVPRQGLRWLRQLISLQD